MKTLILLTGLLLSVPAFSQIGETLEKYTALYGQPKKHFNTGAVIFDREGIEMLAALDESGKIRVLDFRRRDDESNDGQRHLTKKEIDAFMAENGKDWKPDGDRKTMWLTSDKKKFASYERKTLMIRALAPR